MVLATTMQHHLAARHTQKRFAYVVVLYSILHEMEYFRMKKKNGLSSTVTKIFGYILATLIVLFSGYNTFRLLHESSGNLIIATLGLVFFEGGMLYWWLNFQHGSDGLPQMAISLLVFALCLLGVIVANAVELGAYELALGSHLPQQLTVGALIVQLVAKLIFPLVSPETARKIKTRILEGQLMARAETMLDSKMNLVSDDFAKKMSDNARDNLLLSLGHTTGQKIQPVATAPAVTSKENVIEGETGKPGDNFLE